MVNDFGAAALEIRRRRIQHLQRRIGNLRSDLTHDELLLDGFDSDDTSGCLAIYHVCLTRHNYAGTSTTLLLSWIYFAGT